MNDLMTLILEDDASLRGVLKQFLSIYFDVTVAPDLATARALIAKKPFQLFLLDKLLPQGTGLDLIPEIRTTHPDAAVIIMTSDDDLDSIRKALAQGADDYVVKSEHLVKHLLVRLPVALRNAAERSRIKSLEGRVSVQIPTAPKDFNEPAYRTCLESVDKEFLTAALKAFDGNVPLTAEKLGISRSTLFRKISDLGIRES